MNKLVKIVDNKYVQIEEYKNPNICFNTNEYDNFEDYCTLRETFDPFEIFYENQELKSKLELYENGVYFSSEVDEKDKQIDVLKKKYENAVADYETTMFEKEQLNSLVNSCQEEIRQLKKQLEEYEKELETWKKKYPNRAEKIKQYDINGNFIKEHNSSREAGKLLNISEKTISSCVNGHSKTAGGFIWKR